MDNRAIAFPLPEDLVDVLEGLERFVKAEVIRCSDENIELLDDVRRRYQLNGAYSPEVVALVGDHQKSRSAITSSRVV